MSCDVILKSVFHPFLCSFLYIFLVESPYVNDDCHNFSFVQMMVFPHSFFAIN
jgi:hypothetical protein